MKTALKDLAVLCFLTGIGAFVLTIAAMFAYNDVQAALVCTVIYITAPLFGVFVLDVANHV